MEEIKNVEWNDPNKRKQVIFTINGEFNKEFEFLCLEKIIKNK